MESRRPSQLLSGAGGQVWWAANTRIWDEGEPVLHRLLDAIVGCLPCICCSPLSVHDSQRDRGSASREFRLSFSLVGQIRGSRARPREVIFPCGYFRLRCNT